MTSDNDDYDDEHATTAGSRNDCPDRFPIIIISFDLNNWSSKYHPRPMAWKEFQFLEVEYSLNDLKKTADIELKQILNRHLEMTKYDDGALKGELSVKDPNLQQHVLHHSLAYPMNSDECVPNEQFMNVPKVILWFTEAEGVPDANPS